MKKILSLILAVTLMFNFALVANAAEEKPENVARAQSFETFDDVEFRDGDILSERRRSIYKPTKAWDLDDGDYFASLDLVGTSNLYTNFHFKPNSNGIMHLDYNVRAEGGATLIVGLYNITDKRDETTAKMELDVDATGRAGGINYSNLDVNDSYAIYFSSKYNGTNVVYISGSARIYH